MLQGQRLRHMRERRAFSQRTLGTLIGQDGRYISKLELGILRSVTTTTRAPDDRLAGQRRLSAGVLRLRDAATAARDQHTSGAPAADGRTSPQW